MNHPVHHGQREEEGGVRPRDSLIPQAMALPVVGGRRRVDVVDPHRGVRAGGPPAVPHGGRDLGQTWDSAERLVSHDTHLGHLTDCVCTACEHKLHVSYVNFHTHL